MKKIILTLSIIAAAFFASAQQAEYLANKILQNTSAIVQERFSEVKESGETIYTVTAQLPSYYDQELFILKVNSVCSQYSDVYPGVWEMFEDFTRCIIIVVDESLIIGSNSDNFVLIVY